MDCVKNGRSVEDQSEVVVESLSRKRFYECIFCKRGFTNAQALGGHMNIHRKDRQRIGSTSKQVHASSSSSSSRQHVLALKPYSSSKETNTCSSTKFIEGFFDVQKFSSSRRNCEILGDNLSLKIGSGLEEDVKIGEIIKRDEPVEDEIDLELRLGYCR